jgi:hypothetical protein
MDSVVWACAARSLSRGQGGGETCDTMDYGSMRAIIGFFDHPGSLVIR